MSNQDQQETQSNHRISLESPHSTFQVNQLQTDEEIEKEVIDGLMEEQAQEEMDMDLAKDSFAGNM